MAIDTHSYLVVYRLLLKFKGTNIFKENKLRRVSISDRKSVV